MSEQEKLVRVPPIWRGLASMRLGLMLMFLLAVAATIGVLTPQGVLSQNTVLAQIANALGLNQVFSTWWFRALAYLLGANVLACFLNRFNAAINVARSPQVSVAAMERLQYYRTFTDKASPDQVIDRVIQVFQANRYRVLQGQDEEQNLLYADKQRLAVLGPVIAHLGLMLLLAGLVWSSLSGFDGQITVASGQTFKLSEINLTRGTVDQDQDLKLQSAERLISNANLWDARSSLSIMDNGKVVKTGNLGYNAPLNYNGYSVHQVAFIDGVVIDVQDGNIVSPYLVRNVNNQEAVRLADRDISLVFTNIHPSKSKPTATVMVVQDSTSQVLRQGVIGVGQTLSLEDLGVPVSFELDRYLGSAVLRVTEDPGVPLIFSGSLILLFGMILSLFFRYRKVWVAVLPDGDQSQVQVGGFTSKHKLAFTVEFNGLLGEIKAQ